jgi:hypothetical protein
MLNPAPRGDSNFALFTSRFVEQFKQGRLDEVGALQGRNRNSEAQLYRLSRKTRTVSVDFCLEHGREK